MAEITRRELLKKFFSGRGRERNKESISKENKKTKVITRREFLRGLISFLIGLILFRGEKEVKTKKETEWQSPGDEYIKSKNIDEIFKGVGGPETLGEFYKELNNPEELKRLKGSFPTHVPTPTATPITTKTYVPTPPDGLETSEIINITPESITTKVIYRGKPGTKKIAITFDDSANKEFLRELLQIAKENNIKMVWFLIGRTIDGEEAEIIKEALESGLIRIGNHSFNHNISEFSKLNIQYIENEKNSWLKRFKEIGFSEDQLKLYFRPPGGAGGYRGGDKRLLRVLSKNGYRYLCMWDTEFIYTIRTKFNGEYNVENLLEILKNSIYSTGGGNLILFHFNKIDLSALKTILPELIKNGFEFVFPEEL